MPFILRSMDRVFSVDGTADRFWSSTPSRAVATEAEESSKLNRRASEWSFRRFLEEATASESSTSRPPPPASPSSGTNAKKQILKKQSSRNSGRDRNRDEMCSNISATSKSKAVDSDNFGAPSCFPPDSGDYQAFLKSKLNLACAAVAMCRGPCVKAQDSCASYLLAQNESQPKDSQWQSQPHSKGISSSPCVVQTKAGIRVSSATVSSSIEQTDEEDDAIEQMDPADAKRVRRMLSNRESARRSRKRKQAHLTELETQVAELRVENSTLMKRFSDISQQYNEATVNNRVLKADLETLKTKVQMAEEMVRRIKDSKKVFHAMTEVSSTSMQSFDRSPSEISTDAPSNNHITESSANVQKNSPATATFLVNKTARTASLNRVASLEHLQKRIRGSSGTCDPSPSGKGNQQ